MNTWLDLIIPIVLIIGCFLLIGLGIDGEVKSILLLAGGWAFRSSVYKTVRTKPPK